MLLVRGWVTRLTQSWRRGTAVPLRGLLLGLLAVAGRGLWVPPGTLRVVAWPFETARASGGVSEAALRSLESKIAVLASHEPRASNSYEPIVITEAEANSYLRYRGHEFLPAGVHDPEMRIAPDLVSAAAEVDFNELSQAGTENRDWGTRLLALVFRGKQRVSGTGKIETGSGQGKVTVESLTVGTTAIPAGLVNFLLQSYVQRRYKIDISKPFALPPHVTHIELGSGRATFHRRANPAR